MRVRLNGINEEAINPPQTVAPGATSAAPAADAAPVEKKVFARFESPELPPYYGFILPAEAVGDAKIGDEFDVYVERVKK